MLQPSYMFTDKEHRGPFEFSEEIGNMSFGTESADAVVPAQRVEENDKDLLLSTSEREESRGPMNNNSAYGAPLYDGSSQILSESMISNPTAPAQAPVASLAIDDLLGLSLSVSSLPDPPPSPPLKLNAKAVLDPGAFQKKWHQLPISLSQVCLQPVKNIFLVITVFILPWMYYSYSKCLRSTFELILVLEHVYYYYPVEL